MPEKPVTPSTKGIRGIVSWLDENVETPFLVVGLLLSTILVNWQVFFRYILVNTFGFQGTTAKYEELAVYLFIMVSLLSFSVAAKKDKHVRLDLLVRKFPPRWQGVFRIAADGAFLALAVVMALKTMELSFQQYELPQRTPAMGIPYLIPYLSLPVGFTLLSVRVLQNMVRRARLCGIKDTILGLVILLTLFLPIICGPDLSTGAVLILTLIVGLLAGVPVAAVLGLAAGCALLSSPFLKISTLAPTPFVALDSFTIMAIFFFICAGIFMGSGGVSKQLIDLADMFLGRRTGGMALVSILACMIFAAICGSGPATVAAIGSITIPAMIERGYSKTFSVAIVAVAGSLGNIIPPSNTYVLYGVLARVSIGDMFLAGIIPGLLMGGIMMLYAWCYSRRHGYRGEAVQLSRREKLMRVWEAKYALFVPVLILGGIYSGAMTPTEASAVAALYGLLVGIFVYKGIHRKNFIRVCMECCTTSCVVIFLLAMANGFGYIMTLERIPFTVAQVILGISENPTVILLIIIGLLLFVGMLMETGAAMIILVPLLTPIAVRCGMDPLHFGMVMSTVLVIGFVTPPVGANLFVGNAISGVPIEKIAREALPLVILLLLFAIVVAFFPPLTLFLIR